MTTEGWQRGALPTEVPSTGERFDELASLRGVVVEQILSSDTPGQETYLQAQDEWVVLLDGHAVLDIDGETVELHAGDHLLLPAGTPHRVLSTVAGSRWLAVHVGGPRRAKIPECSTSTTTSDVDGW